MMDSPNHLKNYEGSVKDVNSLTTYRNNLFVVVKTCVDLATLSEQVDNRRMVY